MSDSLFRSRKYRLATNHVNVVVIMPIIMTSTTIIYRIQKIVWAKVRFNVQVKPIDVTATKDFCVFSFTSFRCSLLKTTLLLYLPKTHSINKTRKAGSSRANCDFVSAPCKNRKEKDILFHPS